jgi:hypothetical protein
MEQKIAKYLIIPLLICAFSISGCGLAYKARIDHAYKQLKLDMNRNALEDLFRHYELLKVQSITRYHSDDSDSDMRYALKHHHFAELTPSNLFDRVSIDGNIQVFTYYVQKTPAFPYGWRIYYISIFYDKGGDKVIGWGRDSALESYARSRSEKF